MCPQTSSSFALDIGLHILRRHQSDLVPKRAQLPRPFGPVPLGRHLHGPMMVNALRAHLAEFGVIAPRGLRNVGELIAITRDESDARLPGLAQQVLQVLAGQIEQIETVGGSRLIPQSRGPFYLQ